jgi:NAD(P) transhydrogenase subunit beta
VRTDQSSQIYGMPILNMDGGAEHPSCSSMAAGFSGVESELFHHPRTAMLFGDAKKSIESLITSAKEV